MTSYAGGGTQVLRHSSGNPWGSFIHQRSLEDSRNPPKNVPTLQNALSAWKRMSGDHGLTLGIQDHVPLPQGHILGAGGGGIVFETRIDGIAMAWKRIITRSHTERERYINEIRILGHMTEQRHRHIINLIGSFTHRLRNHNYELSIITWPVARCDLSALMREVDSINDWKSRDETHSGRIRATQPTDEEKTAFENILKLENLEQDRSTLSTWHFREYSLNKTLQRLTRSIGCVAEAIKYLHDKGIRHKDIKPSQILVSSDGLWLTDFGWSKDISQLTTSETSGGDRITIRYHAPEREEWRPCGRAEDIFSLGCTFLEMGYRICGFRPKDYLKPTNSSPWSFQANLGSMHLWLAPFRLQETSLESFLSGVIERMMAYETRERPTIDEVTALLRLHSRRDRDSFFGPCCKPHESLGKSANEDSFTPESGIRRPQGDSLSLEQLRHLGRHEGVPVRISEDAASTAVAYSDRDPNFEESGLHVQVNDENRAEAPITRFVRILHEAQSLPFSSQAGNLSSSFSDGTAIQCICGKPDITSTWLAERVRCIQCKSWQHITCYYAPAEKRYRLEEHECLMCKSEASALIPTKGESPLRLENSVAAHNTGQYGILDHNLPRFLRDTARAINAQPKTKFDHVRRYGGLPTSINDIPSRTSRISSDEQPSRDGIKVGTNVLDPSTRMDPVFDTFAPALEPWSPLDGQHYKGELRPGASVQTRYGPRASTPQVPMRTYPGGPRAHNGNIKTKSRDWPDDLTTNQARDLDISSDLRRDHIPPPSPASFHNNLRSSHRNSLSSSDPSNLRPDLFNRPRSDPVGSTNPFKVEYRLGPMPSRASFSGCR